jgi:hypothetical protein
MARVCGSGSPGSANPSMTSVSPRCRRLCARARTLFTLSARRLMSCLAFSRSGRWAAGAAEMLLAAIARPAAGIASSRRVGVRRVGVGHGLFQVVRGQVRRGELVDDMLAGGVLEQTPARGRGHREALLGLQHVAVHRAHALEVVAERQGRAAAHAHLHGVPVLARGVVHDGPALEADLARGVQHHAVAGFPGRRLGHVGEHHVADSGAVRGRGQRDGHVHRAAPARRRAGPGERHRQGFARLGIGHRE